MKDFTPFQLIATAVFGMFILIGFAVFAIGGGNFGGKSVGPVVVWGTMPQTNWQKIFEILVQKNASFKETRYEEKHEETYHADLLNAIANGTAPDVAILTQEDVQFFRDKLTPIPYATVSQQSFRSAFIDEADLFLSPSGVLAMPILVDPLMMYYNKDLLNAAGIAAPPAYWVELVENAPRITAFDDSRNISRSTVALGQWGNVDHAKEIISTLLIQAGDPITRINNAGVLSVVFGLQPEQSAETPAASVLRFYTSFADPSQSIYSWNRSLPHSADAFTAGQLVFYFGFASEYKQLAERNPNIRFEAAQMPQIKDASARAVYGILYGAGIPRGARNPQGGAVIAQALSSSVGGQSIVAVIPLPSARRELLKEVPESAALTTFRQSALLASGWLDPEPSATASIFQSMVESVLSGRTEPTRAVYDAAQEMRALIP